jgi:hypothetical protein
MMLVDVNLLLYAVNSDLSRHAQARSWFEQALSGIERVGLPWVVVLAFLRITTNQRVFEHPLSIETASAYIDEWLQQSVVTIVAPGRAHWNILRSLLFLHGSGGNLATDAHIAALAIEHGARIYSADNDFKRFSGVQHINPLAS